MTTSNHGNHNGNGKRERPAGLLVPVFAIRTENDLGIGDVQGVRKMIDWLRDMGMGFLQVLPINETGGDNSPYNAISSVALEPSTLDVSPAGLQDLSEDEFRRMLEGVDLRALRGGAAVDYRTVKKLKMDLLWAAFERFQEEHFQKGTARDLAFHRFCARERNWLGDYCLFRLLMDMEGGSEAWVHWSADYNTVAKAREFLDGLLGIGGQQTERQLAYYAYVQWTAFAQWESVSDYAHSRGIGLMGDMPFGVSYCSADVFCNPELFDLEWSGGAPPETNFKDDEFTRKWGQNWGIPLYRWDTMEETDFAWWKQRVSRLCRIFSSFRLDHALGFYRIYSFPWRPDRNEEFLLLSEEEAKQRTDGRLPRFWSHADDSEEAKARNRAAGERFLSVVKEAAGDAAVIAEDLGFVPDYVEPSLESLGIPGMKVPLWEKAGDGGPRPGEDYPYLSMATYATHDHEPLKTQWKKLKETIRTSGDPAEVEEASRSLIHLAGFAGIDRDPLRTAYNDHTREAFLRALFNSHSKYASVMITDLLGIEERFNVPGVVAAGNWTTRMQSTVEQLAREGRWRKLASRTKALLQEAGRVTV